MKHYRINKVSRSGGAILKRMDILANTDDQAVERARDTGDCPVCEIWEAGEQVAAIVKK